MSDHAKWNLSFAVNCLLVVALFYLWEQRDQQVVIAQVPPGSGEPIQFDCDARSLPAKCTNLATGEVTEVPKVMTAK